MPISTVSFTGEYSFAIKKELDAPNKYKHVLSLSISLHNGQLDEDAKRIKDKICATIAEDIATIDAANVSNVAIEPTTILVQWEIDDAVNYAKATMQHKMPIASLTDLQALKHFIKLVLPDNGSNEVDGKYVLVVMHNVQYVLCVKGNPNRIVGRCHTPVEPQFCFVAHGKRDPIIDDDGNKTLKLPANHCIRDTNLTFMSNLIYRCEPNISLSAYGPVMAVIAQFPVSSSEKNMQDFLECQKLFLAMVESFTATAKPVFNLCLEDLRFDKQRQELIRILLADHSPVEAAKLADAMLFEDTNDKATQNDNRTQSSYEFTPAVTSTNTTQNNNRSWCFTALRSAASNALSCLGRCNDTTQVAKPGADQHDMHEKTNAETRLALT